MPRLIVSVSRFAYFPVMGCFLSELQAKPHKPCRDDKISVVSLASRQAWVVSKSKNRLNRSCRLGNLASAERQSQETLLRAGDFGFGSALGADFALAGRESWLGPGGQVLEVHPQHPHYRFQEKRFSGFIHIIQQQTHLRVHLLLWRPQAFLCILRLMFLISLQ